MGEGKNYIVLNNWTKRNILEVLIVLAIILLASFFRFYKIDQYMTFLGDEGRDALAVREIVAGHHFPLLGPPTSIGNIYLGPLYYYMMSIPFALSNLNPASAAVMVGIIGVATVGLIYYLTRVWFGKYAAIVSSLLYAMSPVTIIYSRSSWNPNPAPFFALLTILGFHLSRVKQNYLWLVVSGVSLAFILQMHYLALILLPIVFILWLYEIKSQKKNSLLKKHFILGTALGILFFIALMSPLFFFDVRHNFVNFRAIQEFFTNRQTTVNLNILNSLSRTPSIYINNLIGRYMAGEMEILAVFLSLVILISLIWKKIYWPSFILGTWLIVGVLGLSLYKQTLFDHYLGFINPAPFILYGSSFYFLDQAFKRKYPKSVFKFLLVTSVIVLTVVNLNKSPLKKPPNNQLKRTQEIARFVISAANDKPYNFALLSAHNYDSAYQFYLEIYNHKLEQVPFKITSQLFVVCEDPVCQPINNPKYEIAAFGWSKIESMENFEGVKVYKLVHNFSGKQ